MSGFRSKQTKQEKLQKFKLSDFERFSEDKRELSESFQSATISDSKMCVSRLKEVVITLNFALQDLRNLQGKKQRDMI